MQTWILIILFYSNVGKGIDHIPDFQTEQECIDFGTKVKEMGGFTRGYVVVNCIPKPDKADHENQSSN